MEFKKGDKVRVSSEYTGYGEYVVGKVGTVAYVEPHSRKIGVRLCGMINPTDIYGWFNFYPNELSRLEDMRASIKESPNKKYGYPFTIKDVIFNDPAVIVLWADGSKTVVKCSENDIFDPEKGLAMAISKKALGNQGNYYETFKKYLPEEEDNDDLPYLDPLAGWFDTLIRDATDSVRNLTKNLKATVTPAEMRLCTTCKHLCQSLDSFACLGCTIKKEKWEPADLKGESK